MKLSVLKQNASLFKVLGHTKRLEIVCLLQGHSLTVNQIVQMTALRQASVSQHLMFLKANKLVTTQKIGKEIYYSLSCEPFNNLTNFIQNLTKLRPLEDAEPTVVDPICQMHLTPSSATYTDEYNGVRQYFCGKGCYNEFRKKYL
ncbi:MAG: metalloregulator ArsR/SmtB family transcription factor [bacterium]